MVAAGRNAFRCWIDHPTQIYVLGRETVTTREQIQSERSEVFSYGKGEVDEIGNSEKGRERVIYLQPIGKTDRIESSVGQIDRKSDRGSRCPVCRPGKGQCWTLAKGSAESTARIVITSSIFFMGILEVLLEWKLRVKRAYNQNGMNRSTLCSRFPE